MSDQQPPGRDKASRDTAPTVYLHIGTFKSGTSYLQSVLVRNRDLLAKHGVLFPTGERKWGTQVRAVRDVLGMKGATSSVGAWDQLVAMVHASPTRAAVISMEFLSLADPDTVRRIVDDLSPCQIEVILGARDLARVMPSAWQSMIKQGHAWSIEEFVDSVKSETPELADPHRRFWKHHDLDQIIEAWGGVVGEDRIHLLTVPRSGAPPTLLWERFASIIGVDPAEYDTSQDKGSNFSLSFSDTELMRRLNVQLRPDLDRATFKRWATRFFANHVLRAGDADEAKDDRAVLDPATHEWAARRSEEMVDQLQRRSVQVVGDLAELVPPPVDHAGPVEPNVPKIVYPDAAVVMIARLVKRLAKMDPDLGGPGGGRRGGGRSGAGERAGPRRGGGRRGNADSADPGGGARAGERRAQREAPEEPSEWSDEATWD